MRAISSRRGPAASPWGRRASATPSPAAGSRMNSASFLATSGGFCPRRRPEREAVAQKPCKAPEKGSSTPNRPEAQVEVQVNWPKKASGWADDLLPVCTIAPHVALRRPVPAEAVGGCGSRAGADATPGCASASERDPPAPSLAEAGPEGWPRADPRPPARSARVPADGQGLRPAAGGAEVRAREGEPHPYAVPDLAVEDDRRPVRAPARRARLFPAPLSPASRPQ